MRLPEISIKNYQFVVVVVFMILATGLLSYLNMPRSEDPILNVPNYSVVVVYPGTSPKDMEELVVNPIEDKISELEDIEEVRTDIEEGIAIINVEASFGVDVDEKYDEVVAAVNTVEGDLPEEILDLDVSKFSPMNVVIAQLALSSDVAGYAELVERAEELENELEQVNGVRQVDIEAYPEQEVRISLDLDKIARLGLPLTQVLGILQQNNANIPGGDINVGTQNVSIKTSGGYKTLESLQQAVLGANEGQLIYLRDVAEVEMDYEDEEYIGRFMGEKAVFVSITQKEGENILTITEGLDTRIAAFQETLPAHIHLDYAFKQGPAVAQRINDFFLNLLQGVLLVGLIILIFMGIRNSLIIMTVIPASILIAIYLLDMAGFGLQQISIAGLVIALGLLVDNGIVVVENIRRFLREGLSPVEAAIQGASEVGWAIVSSTATTVLAFFPMTQLGGGTGEFLKSLPIIVIFSLLASLVLALAFTPLLSSLIMKPISKEKLSWIDRGWNASLQKAIDGY